MKKFMTVLLVIAVMFTFSFGSAFAETKYTAVEVVAAMQAEAEDYCKLIEAQGTQFMKGADYSAYDAAAKKAVVDTVVKEQQAAFLAEVVKLQAVVKGEYTAAERATAVAGVAALYNSHVYDVTATVVTELKVSVEQFAIDKAEAQAELAKIDVTKYNASTATKDLFEVKTAYQSNMTGGELKVGDKVSKAEFVEAVVKYVAKLVDETVVSKTVLADNQTAIANFTAWVNNVKAVLADVDTLEDEADAVKSEEELKAYRTSIMEGELALAEAKVRKVLNDELANLKKAATVDAEKVAKVEGELADLDAQYDAAKEVLAAMIAEGAAVTTSHLECANYAGFAAVKTALEDCEQRAADVEKFEAYAAVIVNVTDASGAKIYDAEDVADIVEDVVADIYMGTATYASAAKPETFEAAKIAGAATLAQKKAAVDEIKAYKNVANYDEAQAEEVEALVDGAVADIMAAATKADIDKVVKAAKKELDKVVTKSVHDNDWLSTGKLGKEFAKTYQNELAGYADYAEAKLPAKGYADAKTALQTGAAAPYANIPAFAMEIVKEAYTVDEIAAKVAEAKAAIDSLKSDAEIEAAADAVEAMIAQIKVPVTLEQAEAIVAANEAAKEYVEIVGASASDISNKPLLDAAMGTLKALVKAELVDEVKALDKATLTAADAAKVEALEDAVELYNETFNDTYAPDLAAMKAEVKAAKFADVVAAMVAIPAEPTAADKDAVEAARAAYDALELEEKIEFAADKLNALYLDKLVAAEAQVAAAVAAEEAAMIKEVEALKITAGSSAKKGAITVKWTVKGDTSAVQGYEIWKSTKKNSGYKKMFTTTKQTYKNTKGLKKGTRYYYKVRAIAYTAEGVKVKSDWSNKAYRIAK